jgi:hypothetical protein
MPKSTGSHRRVASLAGGPRRRGSSAASSCRAIRGAYPARHGIPPRRRSALFVLVACCMFGLHVACLGCMLHVACCMLHAVCGCLRLSAACLCAVGLLRGVSHYGFSVGGMLQRAGLHVNNSCAARIYIYIELPLASRPAAWFIACCIAARTICCRRRGTRRHSAQLRRAAVRLSPSLRGEGRRRVSAHNARALACANCPFHRAHYPLTGPSPGPASGF